MIFISVWLNDFHKSAHHIVNNWRYLAQRIHVETIETGEEYTINDPVAVSQFKLPSHLYHRYRHPGHIAAHLQGVDLWLDCMSHFLVAQDDYIRPVHQCHR